MTFPPSQILETATKPKGKKVTLVLKHQKGLCYYRQSLGTTCDSKKVENNANSDSGTSKSVGQEVDQINLILLSKQLLRQRQQQRGKERRYPKKTIQPMLPLDSPAMATRSKKWLPASPAMSTRSKRLLIL
ncbi:hypothetical protein GQ55_9G579700 [Panicum hallii var. hallii]|uniref:Uncharacterized protein n=1 Tax=Panicum hallii var. hallii TaxID=1504633 RepID=A0A2T7CGM6_9POAL|nr:hypothetical protein GQ55_9G579700 [Panicum hallii var. hallii]